MCVIQIRTSTDRGVKTLNRRTFAVLIALILLVLVGCGPLWPRLAFTVHFFVNVDGHTVASMKVHNTAKMPFYGDKNFDGVLELRNEWGDVLVHQEVPELDRLPADEFTWPTAWKGALTAGNYQWVWGAPDHGFTLVDFSIVKRNGELHLDEGATKISQVKAFPEVKSVTPPNPPTSTDPMFLLPESAVPFQRASADLNGDRSGTNETEFEQGTKLP
jgi:hypothetical protein